MSLKYKINIKDRRKELGLSQEALAEIVGVSQRQISKYETGQSDLSAETLNSLADALDTTADYLLGRIEKPERPLRGEYDLDDVEREAVMILRSRPVRERQKLLDVWKVLA